MPGGHIVTRSITSPTPADSIRKSPENLSHVLEVTMRHYGTRHATMPAGSVFRELAGGKTLPTYSVCSLAHEMKVFKNRYNMGNRET